ncbi:MULTISPECIES: hypothetical protein [Leptospira]|uniref:Uncharacterized protein n=2 Tax=Leptospira borgpetersenii TaxID=174 RepID=M3HKA1_LEPBO|nr:hypothetical protein [Leptospira borgpetersenii]AXX15380.1 hypothetical protein C4Q31_07315 [Leptospira borgpetersenii serovar Ceylonica]EMF98069.1 hypothetical protein LEP1GSC123_3940 [Leptospira borgpetersenii str. 200701203]EMN59003.1 hypothetical protein LEP1GSC090_2995 [Leptospira borgpetersenii serovar Javanica str. MK146]EPG59857.1 hypothetical protein LEP1GSC103_0888 [Leptospira borgpetersenii serovar Javanica str. UI 09931]
MHEKNTVISLFQKLEYRSSSKKPTIPDSAQFCEDFYLYKNCPFIFGTIFTHPNSNFVFDQSQILIRRTKIEAKKSHLSKVFLRPSGDFLGSHFEYFLL